MNYTIQKLDRKLYDSINTKFHSGNDFIDNFINSTECLDEGLGITYIFLGQDNSIVAYFNITTGAIIDTSNSGLKTGGSVHINKFGLDVKYQGVYLNDGESKLSDMLFYLCLQYIMNLRNYIGFTFITLCSTKEGVHLYQRAGFEFVEEDMSVAHDFEEKGCYEMYFALDLENICQ